MSEQNQHDVERTTRRNTGSASKRRPDGFAELESLDSAQEAARLARARSRAVFPKDDRRSSELLTERERSERWPLG